MLVYFHWLQIQQAYRRGQLVLGRGERQIANPDCQSWDNFCFRHLPELGRAELDAPVPIPCPPLEANGLTISVLNWRYTGPTCCVLSTCVFLSTCFVLSTLLCSLHMLCSLHIAWFSHADFSLHVFSSLHMMCQQRHLFYWRFEGESHNASWHSSSCIADHWFP